jgi:hypothetical protein
MTPAGRLLKDSSLHSGQVIGKTTSSIFLSLTKCFKTHGGDLAAPWSLNEITRSRCAVALPSPASEYPAERSAGGSIRGTTTLQAFPFLVTACSRRSPDSMSTPPSRVSSTSVGSIPGSRRITRSDSNIHECQPMERNINLDMSSCNRLPRHSYMRARSVERASVLEVTQALTTMTGNRSPSA